MTFRRAQAIRAHQAAQRDRLICYQAAVMIRQIEQYLTEEAQS